MNVIRAYAYGFAIPRTSAVKGFQAGSAAEQWNISEQFMVEDLAKSGLTPEDILAYPCIMNLPRGSDAAYVIPYYGQDGKVLASKDLGVTGHMYRVRARPSSRMSRDDLRKFSKYTQPSRAIIGEMATIPYILPGWWEGDGSMGWYIIEGEKKAAAFAKRMNAPTMCISGCNNWHHPDPRENGEVHPWIKEALEEMSVHEVTIIPDGDIARHEINRAYNGLKRALERINVSVRLVNFSRMDPSKIDDWLVANPQGSMKDVDGWPVFRDSDLLENRAELVREYQLLHKTNAAGALTDILPVEYNCVTLFERHPYYRGAFRFNLDTLKIDGDYDIDSTITTTTTELQNNFGIHRMTRAVVRACIGLVAQKRAYSPIRDWLEQLAWDGKKRLWSWMIKLLGAADTPYIRELSKKSILAAVARRMDPGCVVDFMTILKGRQGVGKSSAIKLLFGSEHVLELMRGSSEGKDGIMSMAKAWVVSDEELGMHTRTEMNKMKAFLTIRRDVWRPPYGLDTLEKPRAFVVWGSTNNTSFLTADPSGHRRYAVVEVNSVDFKGIVAMRDQLFAEAMELYRNKEMDYSNIENTTEEVQAYVVEDALMLQVEKMMENWMNGAGKDRRLKHLGVEHYGIRLNDVGAMLGWDYKMYTQETASRHLSDVMRQLGWSRILQKRVNWDKSNGPLWVKPLV